MYITLNMTTPKKSRLLSPLATLALTTALATALAASSAQATWSILITDTRTGEFVVGSATCLTGFDLAIETPIILTGVGAITAQSAVDATGTNRMFVRDRLLEGQPLSQILNELSTLDPGHNNRQYGMITTTGDTLTYSGIDNANWAGGITGRIEQGRPGPQDDIVYAVQGNILTGQPVVQAAVDALIAADTDLPGKLMAAMLAARITGGDGRCSCSPSAPTNCGSPPPGDFKSAHVGYMIGSRADDTDSIRAFYELPNSQTSTALTKLDQNQYALSDTDGNIHIYTNATNTNDQVAHFNFQQTIQTNLTDLTKLTAADLDNNGLNDLVTLSGTQDISVFLQTAPNTFDPPIPVTIDHSINDIETINIKDLPGEQLVLSAIGLIGTYHFDGTQLILVNRDYDEGTHIASQILDINNDNIQDIIEINLRSQVQIEFRTLATDGTFTPQPPRLFPSENPIQLRAADINNDGLIDILVATGSSRVIDTFINTGTPENPTFATKISSPIAAPAIDFQITDLNNDSVPDIAVIMTSGANLRYYLGDNNGNFTETNRTRLGGAPTNILQSDLNNDGDQDLITNATSKLLIYDNLGNATVQRQTGFARGDKFMFINIANQNAAADDPVDQMQTHFADFRASLTGKIDAIQTTTSIPSRVLIDDPSPPQTIRIELRDWQSNLITAPATFTLHFNQQNLTPSLPIKIAPGIYNIPISANSANKAMPGPHTLKIQATINNQPDTKPVTLMPSLTISTTNSLADFNADSYHDFFDIAIFLKAFTAQNPIADLNNDTLFDTTDITLFLTALKSAP